MNKGHKEQFWYPKFLTSTQGTIGTQGTTGSQGDKGGLRYGFEANTSMANPGSGDFRLNNGTIGSVTALAIHQTTDDGATVKDYLLTWDDSGTATDKGNIIIKSNTNDDATYAIFKIDGSITDNTSWLQIPVDYAMANPGTLPSAADSSS